MHRSIPIAGIMAVVVGIICVSVGSTGCENRQGADVVPVTGKVLLDGEPLRFGTVTLQPSRGQPARGEINSNGEFTLSTYRQGDGAAVGRHKVKVVSYTSQDPAAEDSSAGPNESLGASLIPDRYSQFDTSGLEVAILAGGDKPYVIELQSDSEEVAPAEETAGSEEGAAPVKTDSADPAKAQDDVSN